ncbi:serine/threonine-protein kinase [Actinophytocola algeriensis]|uniref:non-specific serine/threonine protein kinase n=1 Tax=Actinophytocola algeriensis TaxID=1768010 RepID=A0A7W7VHX5_9PSEU|nr:serine/threonine-protein kinase [Actinophytocola algeriensis]MBB4910500.1 serine/threonine protein kinase [Actinophytocola algeriensis]MBE1480511.1 serine/threonine protein kinase [Actinophytocola algeriensis]
MTEEHPTLIAGRYRIGTMLGRGGMGVVWRATDEFLEREVAIKEMRLPVASGQETATAHGRTMREARSAAKLSHTAIITVHDVITHDDRPWIVMELIDGPSLAEVVRLNGPLPRNRVADIAISLLTALDAAHRKGILHRDVKPANVLVDGDRVVLTDFGIAAVDGSTALTATNQIIGSPQYLAPERITDGRTGPPGDLWSLGVTLYVALTGRPRSNGRTPRRCSPPCSPRPRRR